MKTRIISGLIMLPFLGIIILGDYVLMGACFLIGIGAVYEFYKGFESLGIYPSYIIGIIGTIGIYVINLLGLDPKWYMLLIVTMVTLSCLYLFKIEERKLEDAMATLLGLFYVVFFSFHVTLVDQEISSFVWLIILTAFGTDVMAYFTGYFLGRHKLSPKISPKKTIEGSIGGILGSVILCGTYGYFFMPEYMIHAIVIGALGGVLSQIGDLTASIFKRKMGIKDYGSLIPGHGGVLDRFDSVLFTAPLVYYYIMFVING